MRLKRWERPEVEGGAPTGEWRWAGRASRPRSNAGEDRRVRRRAPRRRVERELWQQQQLEAQQERQRQREARQPLSPAQQQQQQTGVTKVARKRKRVYDPATDPEVQAALAAARHRWAAEDAAWADSLLC